MRDKLDIEERVAKELWLVCNALEEALRHGPGDNLSGQITPRSIAEEIGAIKETLNERPGYGSDLARLALESIPTDALRDGVYSEDALIQRFANVERLCRRVALIGDEGGSLFRYFLSYLQSLLIVNSVQIPTGELEGKDNVDPSKWDTFDVLARVRHSLKYNNLEAALRYANQLRGEPRRVAHDWIKDARVHLETRQAANILLTQAASIGVQSLN